MRSTITRPAGSARWLGRVVLPGVIALVCASWASDVRAASQQAPTADANTAAETSSPVETSPATASDAAPDDGTDDLADVDEPAEDSPRASLRRYLNLCREGKYVEAADTLDVPARDAADAPVLARKLKAVLDRYIWFDLDTISGNSEGDPDDHLPPGVDQLGTIPTGSDATPQPVRFVRRTTPDGIRWKFSRATVERIDTWYDALAGRWALENLPKPLLRPGPGELLWWQWLALPLLLALAWGLGRILSAITRSILHRLASRTQTEWDDAIIDRLSEPLTLGWMIFSVYMLVPWLDLYEPARVLMNQILRAGLFVVFFWSLLRTVEIVGQMIIASPRTADLASLRSLVPLGVRSVKAAIFAMGVIAVISDLGYPVTSLLAGLSIGGLALALAAQKTGENVFGAFSLGFDQPFREGDFVKIEDFVGTVETVGLRSTRFRTLDRTLISIPNGKLEDMRLESFTARDRLRLACTVGLEYGTSAAQMRQVLEGLEKVLRGHPLIFPDAVVVRFKEFGASSLDIEIMAWFLTPVWSEFQLIRQEVLLQFMEVVEGAGTSFAFPTRTVHLVKEEG